MLLVALSRFWEWLRHPNVPGPAVAVGRFLAKLRWWRTRVTTRRRTGREWRGWLRLSA